MVEIDCIHWLSPLEPGISWCLRHPDQELLPCPCCRDAQPQGMGEVRELIDLGYDRTLAVYIVATWRGEPEAHLARLREAAL